MLPHHNGLAVVHSYHDHASDPSVDPNLIKYKAKGGVVVPFPVKLHSMLDKIEADGLGHVVSWQPHGRCFVVHDTKEFVRHVMPVYFKQTKMASFQRQLNLYGFNRLTNGLDKGGYYHELFLRGKVSLAYDIHRMRVKGTGVRMPTNPESEPNFYALPPVTTENVYDAPSSSAMPPLPVPPLERVPSTNMEQRRVDLLRESRAHSLKIAQAERSRQQRLQSQSDLVFFEGLPFHYLDPSALPALPKIEDSVEPVKRPAIAKSSSTVVSDSDEADTDDLCVPGFSTSDMDWEGPLSTVRRDSGAVHLNEKDFGTDGPFSQRALEDDIEAFFRGFDTEYYHDQIEHMAEDDDTAYGYLLEQAIAE